MAVTTIPSAGITDATIVTADLADDAVTAAKAAFSPGKIIGVQDNVLGTGAVTTSGTYADVISTTYTPSATTSYLLVHVNINYRLHGLSSTTTPNGYVQIISPTTTRATRHIQTKLPANSDNEKGFASFYAYWNPNTTSPTHPTHQTLSLIHI